MIQKFTRLQTRFFLCYLSAVCLPILLFSIITYSYHCEQSNREYINEKNEALITEQNYLENQLDRAVVYFNQIQSNYEMEKLLRGFYTRDREVIYCFNAHLNSLLRGIYIYDDNLSGITIFTREQKPAELLPFFDSYSSFEEITPPSPQLNALLTQGFWMQSPDGSSDFGYYIGFPNPPMSIFPAVVAIHFNSAIFDACAADNPDSAVYVYLNDQLLYRYHTTPKTDAYLIESEEKLFTEETAPIVYTDSSNQLAVSRISLADDVFRIIKLTPRQEGLFSYRPFLLSLTVSALTLFCSSILMFWLIFRPMKNIAQLSAHMNSQNTHTLAPYTGLLPRSDDETRELILSFNQMTERINNLSSSLLNHEIQLKTAQLEALQAQLNPHFFYGTLESIRMLAEANQQPLISEIAFSFGQLMRYSLSREYLVPVSKELDMTRQYVSIQEKRLANRFDIQWKLTEVDDKWRCPKFILFSMVENVFSHNVSKCRKFIHITIETRTEEDDLIFCVSNTGPGITPERLTELHYLLKHPESRDRMQSENNGRSIFNISDRLKLFYGEGYDFTIESTVNELTVCSVRIHRNFIGF